MMKSLIPNINLNFLFGFAFLLIGYSFILYQYFPDSKLERKIELSRNKIQVTESEILLDKNYFRNELQINLDSVDLIEVFNGNVNDEQEEIIRNIILELNEKEQLIYSLNSEIKSINAELVQNSSTRLFCLILGLSVLILALQFFILRSIRGKDPSKYEIVRARDEIEKLLYFLHENKFTGDANDLLRKRKNMEKNIIQLNKIQDQIDSYLIAFKHPVDQELIENFNKLRSLGNSLRPNSEDEKVKFGGPFLFLVGRG